MPAGGRRADDPRACWQDGPGLAELEEVDERGGPGRDTRGEDERGGKEGQKVRQDKVKQEREQESARERGRNNNWEKGGRRSLKIGR